MKRIISTIFMSFMVAGCMTLGQHFDAGKVPDLKLTKTRLSEALAMFGKPERKEKIIKKNDTYEKLFYQKLQGEFFGGDYYQVLHLEFKNDKLNAYHYVSSNKEDRTIAHLSKTDQIAVHQSSLKDVVRLLGIPSGRARCPTLLYTEEIIKCVEGGHLLAWREKVPGGFWDVYAKFKAIYISFDADDIVNEIIVVDSSE